jgi:hypothetical protein
VHMGDEKNVRPGKSLHSAESLTGEKVMDEGLYDLLKSGDDSDSVVSTICLHPVLTNKSLLLKKSILV